MTRSNLWTVAAVVVASLLPAEEAFTAPTTHWVNDDASSDAPPGTSCDQAGYSTIQAAVDAAIAGDVINVCPGTYTENVVIGTSNLTVMSTDGAAVTTVNAAAAGIDVFSILRAPHVTIDGFTIVPAGPAGKHDIGVNVAVEGDADATLVHNLITGGRLGVNLGCRSAGSTVAHNTVIGQFESAINVDTCEGSPFTSDGNSVHDNIACGGMFAYSIAAGGHDNQVHHNVAKWITINGTGNTVHHNTAKYFAIAAGNTAHHNTTDPNACEACVP